MAADAPEVACCCSCLARNISAAAAAPPGPPLRAADKRPLMALAESACDDEEAGGGEDALSPLLPSPGLGDDAISRTSSSAELGVGFGKGIEGALFGTRSRKETLVFCCSLPFSPTI